ncbi:spore maturation protein [Firmicutes bacterium CAG:884]|nr:spore maturation protein [Firmicutes bacterium CAG:884]
MVKLIWFNLIFIGIVFSILTGNNITETIIKVPNEALSICLQIFPNIALWLGIMKIAENAGLIDKLAKITSKIIRPLFKEIPENHKSLGYISSNIVINMLGVGNVATPIGLKAMKSLQELNNTDRASKSMITFLVMNTSGLTLFPTTILALRTLYNSNNPSKVILPCILVTFLSTIISLIIDYIFRKLTND